MKTLFLKVTAIVATTIVSSVAIAQEAQSLDQLLKLVEQGRISEASDNRTREQKFLSAKNNQQQTLKKALSLKTEKEQFSAQLEKQFEANELRLADKQGQLKERMGNLTELFGHLTSTAGDLRSNFENSLISSQYPDREVFLDALIAKMSSSEQLPSIDEIERLWFEIQREMTESGRVVAFTASIVKPDGEQFEQKAIRVGSFNIISEQGQYLQFTNGQLSELARQPSGPYLDWSAQLATSSKGLSAFGIDPTGPSGGSYLSALIDSPTLVERWHQGGLIGYIITAVGVFALLLGLFRLLILAFVESRVSTQIKSEKANTNNPLGRVLKVKEDNPELDLEALELKLSETVLHEVPKLEKNLNLLKIIAAIAPLMGLLGTVTGMIITFQAITIFGAGDPKAMAGGISGALVTTVLGLIVAIPTILLHTMVNSRARKITSILIEQSTGIMAARSLSEVKKITKTIQPQTTSHQEHVEGVV